MLYGAYRLLRLGLLVDSRGLSGAEPEAPLPIGVLIAHNLAGLLLAGATESNTSSLACLSRGFLLMRCWKHPAAARGQASMDA